LEQTFLFLIPPHVNIPYFINQEGNPFSGNYNDCGINTFQILDFLIS